MVLSEEVFNGRSGTVIAIAVTGQQPAAGFPLTVEITSARLPNRSWVKVSRIRTLSTARLGTRLGRLSPEDEVEQVIADPARRPG